jgi:hypothetical protein
MTKSIVACLEDLFFRSKIDATARHLNVPVRYTNTAGLAAAIAEGGVAAALVELSPDALESIRKIRAGTGKNFPIVGFLSHVDRELAKAAEEAGVTQVMARSQFSETLPDLLMNLVAPGTHREVQEEPELPDE